MPFNKDALELFKMLLAVARELGDPAALQARLDKALEAERKTEQLIAKQTAIDVLSSKVQSQANDNIARQKELDNRQEGLDVRSRALNDQSLALDARERLLAKREEDVSAREVKLAEQVKDHAESINAREAHIAQRESDIAREQERIEATKAEMRRISTI